MTEAAELRDLIRAERDRLGMTQEELAEAIGMSQRWVSSAERGEIKQPKVSTLTRLARVFGRDVADLVIAAGLAGSRSGAQAVAESDACFDPTPDDILESLGDDLAAEVAKIVMAAAPDDRDAIADHARWLVDHRARRRAIGKTPRPKGLARDRTKVG
jgi:transcriptional regulator with XRE-family HTH domain